MSSRAPPAAAAAGVSAPPPAPPGGSSVWSRVSAWASENKAVVYTIAGVAVVVTGAGVVYYVRSGSGPTPATPKANRKERRKRKESERKGGDKSSAGPAGDAEAKAASVEEAAEAGAPLPEFTDETAAALTAEQRGEYAGRLKEAGNAAYSKRNYQRAIELYSQAILLKPDPIYYSNRAACYSSSELEQWERVVDDCTAAIQLNPDYVKALNRRAHAYEHLDMYRESLLDSTASCIIEGFRNDKAAASVERVLQKHAKKRARELMAGREPRMPSATFVGNYLQSFRPRPRPAGLEDSADLADESGPGQLRRGLQALEKQTGEGYDEAWHAFERALELGGLGGLEALAYNMRGTFRCMLNRTDESLADLTRSIELDPAMTQSYIKRASLNLELSEPDKALDDYARAVAQDPDDPDIYYHRAQLHFIKQEYSEAAKDYQRSIDLDRDFIFSHIQLGVTQYKMDSIASSMATFRRCVKNFDRVPDVHNYYGELLLDQGKFQDAIDKFDRAMEIEAQTKPMAMNVLPLINKALALVQWKQDFGEAEKLCEKALIIDPDCDIAIATMAQLLLQQGRIVDALKYFNRTVALARTEGELVNALSYITATETQITLQEKYPRLAAKVNSMGMGPMAVR